MNPYLLVFIVCFRDEEDFLAIGASNSGTFSVEDCVTLDKTGYQDIIFV
jgi:hypothetical protein